MKGRRAEAGCGTFDRKAAAAVAPVDELSALEPWLRLRAIDRLGDRTLLKLVQVWGSPGAVLQAPRSELLEGGCSPALTDAVLRGPDDEACRLIERELADLRRTSIRVRTFLDQSYPARLRTIPDPPPLLYVSGTLNERDSLAIAMVGARRATAAGRLLTEELARELAESGFTVVSGLARGVDAAAHRGAIAGGGRTIAVLGCGADLVYPPEHDKLRREIEERGAVVSELPLGAPPHSAHFPRRNRIISGLSVGVVVTEAAINSGSLITARLAADQGREVFAVPGFVKSETSRGTNALIKEGATLVECAQDVIDAVGPQLEPSLRPLVRRPQSGRSEVEHLGEEERMVHEALSHDPRTVDELIDATQLPVSSVMAALLSLELKKGARHVSGQCYVRV